jgi:phosphatidylglycerol:prolipoprotein diacylglycerol transferase
VPLGIVFARVYYIIFSNWSYYQTFVDVINIRAGGMAIYGGIIGGALGLVIVSRIKKVGFFVLADVVVMCVLLAQGIGRWGNFVNKEAYGSEVAKHVPPFTVDIYGVPHLATYLYESILNFIGFGVLLYLFFYLRKRNQFSWGMISGLYLVWYGVSRAIIEPMRADSLLIFGHTNRIIFNRVSFMLSIALIAVGVLIFTASRKKWTSQTTPPVATKTDT